MSLGLANGQLAASSGTVLGAGTVGRVIALTLHNTSLGVEQTVVLTVSRQGGTGRTVFRAKLDSRETVYIDGLKLDPADVLSGYATGATTVDYDVTIGQGPFTIWARDADGAPKSSADITLSTTEKAALTMDGVVIAGWLEKVHDVLLKIA